MNKCKYSLKTSSEDSDQEAVAKAISTVAKLNKKTREDVFFKSCPGNKKLNNVVLTHSIITLGYR